MTGSRRLPTGLAKLGVFSLALACLAALASDRARAAEAPQPDMTELVCAKARDLSAYRSKSLALLVPGSDGFLFRSRIDMRDYGPLKSGPKKELLKVIAALRERGTEVVLVVPPPRPVADRSRLLAAEVATLGYDVAAAEAGYTAMLDDLRADGVLVADVLGQARAHLGAAEPFYLRRDIHWSSDGARIAAEAAAATIAGLPARAALEPAAFTTEKRDAGDADEKLGEALEKLCDVKVPAERESFYRTSEADAEAGLFGERAPEVVLVGTSFSHRGDDDPNFSGFLQQALSTRVLNASEEGGGFEGSMAAYLRSDTFREAPPKVIVWEFPPYERPDVDDGKPVRIVRSALKKALAGN
jgi:alginate biosynthesis protein AlgX